MEWVFSLNNIKAVANEFWATIGDNAVVAFHGEMGTGKTTFIHALCEVKGVTGSIGSPTFSIINEYEYYPAVSGNNGKKKILFHMDLYRLKDEAEAKQAGVEEALYSGYACLVEWPEKAPGIFPFDAIHVHITLVDGKTRRIKIGNN